MIDRATDQGRQPNERETPSEPSSDAGRTVSMDALLAVRKAAQLKTLVDGLPDDTRLRLLSTLVEQTDDPKQLIAVAHAYRDGGSPDTAAAGLGHILDKAKNNHVLQYLAPCYVRSGVDNRLPAHIIDDAMRSIVQRNRVSRVLIAVLNAYRETPLQVADSADETPTVDPFAFSVGQRIDAIMNVVGATSDHRVLTYALECLPDFVSVADEYRLVHAVLHKSTAPKVVTSAVDVVGRWVARATTVSDDANADASQYVQSACQVIAKKSTSPSVLVRLLGYYGAAVRCFGDRYFTTPSQVERFESFAGQIIDACKDSEFHCDVVEAYARSIKRPDDFASFARFVSKASWNTGDRSLLRDAAVLLTQGISMRHTPGGDRSYLRAYETGMRALLAQGYADERRDIALNRAFLVELECLVEGTHRETLQNAFASLGQIPSAARRDLECVQPLAKHRVSQDLFATLVDLDVMVSRRDLLLGVEYAARKGRPKPTSPEAALEHEWIRVTGADGEVGHLYDQAVDLLRAMLTRPIG